MHKEIDYFNISLIIINLMWSFAITSFNFPFALSLFHPSPASASQRLPLNGGKCFIPGPIERCKKVEFSTRRGTRKNEKFLYSINSIPKEREPRDKIFINWVISALTQLLFFFG